MIFIVKNDVAERRAVRVGSTEGERVEIVSGVSAGERVVVDGPPELAGGRKLSVR